MAATRILLCVMLMLILTACGGSRRDVQPAPSTPTAITGAPAPEGIDAKLWGQLTSELARVVAARGKVTSLAAQGRGSRVLDFMLLDNLGGTGYWAYRNQGDYDLNGLVTISDLTPIGAHFGKRSNAADWETVQVVDGDGNGEINISDVTPLGNNFGARVAGYVIQEKDSLVGDFETIGFVALAEAQMVQGGFPYFFQIPIDGQPLRRYRVVPSATDVAPYELGVPSNDQGYVSGLPSQPWSQRGGNQYRNCLSTRSGPTSIGEAWTVDLDGAAFSFAGPVADRNGQIYCSSFKIIPENLPSFDGSTGSVWCVDRDGNVQWRYQTDSAIVTQPVLMADSTVLAYTIRNKLIALTPDGKVRWTQQLTTDNSGALWEPSVDEEIGYVLAFDAGPSMRRLNYFGDISNTTALVEPLESNIAPVIAGPWILVPHSFNDIDARFKSSGALDGSLVVAGGMSYGMLIDPNTLMLWIGLGAVGMTLHGEPLDVGNPLTHTSPYDLSTAPALLPNGEIVIGETIPSAVPDDPPTGVIKGIGPVDGLTNWDRPLTVAPRGCMACDIDGNIFVGASGLASDTGIYCIDNSHNVAWFHPTAATAYLGVSIVADDMVAAIHLLAPDLSDSAELVGIKGL